MISEETVTAIAQLYASGWNPEDIAEELGLDEITVIEVCAELLNE